MSAREYPMNPQRVLERVVGKGPFVFLETSRVIESEDKSLLFTEPVEIIRAYDYKGLDSAFYRMERALENGLWLSGYLSYELGYLLEARLYRLLGRMKPDGPLLWLGVFKRPLVFRHSEDVRPVAHAFSFLGHSQHIRDFHLDTSKQRYLWCIEKIKRYIQSGDTYQVNYTVRGRFSFTGDPIQLYLALRAKQAVSYGAFINDGTRFVLSLSPELFFHKKDRLIWSRPMKGTFKRGRTTEEDNGFAAFLSKDEKNRAENVMIVDLLRNDMGRICKLGSVRCPALFTVERYQTLFQMTSTIEGQLLEQARWQEILRALFPCGSVTGAPKIRTMEIIAELESSPRDIYTGSIGFISPDGEACFNVAIRTVILKEAQGELGIGSGVTMDSDPEAEYEESILKADFLTRSALEFELIETMRWSPDEGFYLLERHLERLIDSAHYFGFYVDRAKVLDCLNREASTFASRPMRVRLVLSRDGEVKTGSQPLEKVAQPVFFDIADGVKIDPEDPFLYHKTTNRSLFDIQWQDAHSRGLFDRIFLNKEGQLTQGCITNIFIQTGKGLLTPPLYAGLLPGTLRQELISTGKAKEVPLWPKDLLSARAIYLGNSVRGLLKARYK